MSNFTAMKITIEDLTLAVFFNGLERRFDEARAVFQYYSIIINATCTIKQATCMHHIHVASTAYIPCRQSKECTHARCMVRSAVLTV